jgi:hypothetical protein
MKSMQIQKWLIITGCIFILLGILFPWIVKSGLGRLLGDIYIKNDEFTFYFPIVTCLLLNIIFSLLIWLFNRW